MRYFFVFVSVILTSFAFAQNEAKTLNVGSDTKVLNEQLDMWLVHNNEINKVTLRFCNNGFSSDQLTTSLNLVMKPWQKKDICVALVNQSNISLTVVWNMVPGSLNANGNIVCSNAGELSGDVVVSDFSSFSTPIVLAPQGQLVQYVTLSAADVASGNYYSCFAINLNTIEKLSKNSPFNLLVRKAGNIKITVFWSPYRFQWFDDGIQYLKNNIRDISIVGIILCWWLLVFSLFPVFHRKNTWISKKTLHKK